MTIEIPLTKGQVAIVCDCHAHLVEQYKWSASKGVDGKFYAKRGFPISERQHDSPDAIYMHVVINNTPRGMKTDHRDRNTLNNQCTNLRTATHAQNEMNRGIQSNNTSGFKGVSWNKLYRKWEAYTAIGGKKKNIGYFDQPEDAANAYDAVVRELGSEFARPNFQ